MLKLIAAILVLGLSGCATGPAQAPPTAPEEPGAIQLNQGPPSDVPMGGGGYGTLFFRGRTYSFAIGGLGVDGSAVAIIQTSGEVHQLQDLARFSGTYRKAPAMSGDGLWVRNENAAIIHLRDPPQGRLPELGLDGLRVVLN